MRKPLTESGQASGGERASVIAPAALPAPSLTAAESARAVLAPCSTACGLETDAGAGTDEGELGSVGVTRCNKAAWKVENGRCQNLSLDHVRARGARRFSNDM